MPASVNILFILSDYPALGGIAKVSMQLADYFRLHGYRVDFVAMKATGQPAQQTENIYYLPFDKDFNATQNLQYLIRLIRENDYCFIINQGVVSMVYKAFSQDTKHHFINVWHGCPQWMFQRKRQLTWKNQVAVQKSFKSVLRYLYMKCLPCLYKSNIRREWKCQIEGAAAYVVFTEAYKKETEALLYHGLPMDKIKVIPNPLWPSDIISQKKKIVLYAGRFSRADKRLDRLLRIWASIEKKVPDWQLQLIGEGPDKEALQQLAGQLHLKRIVFLDTVWDDCLYAEASVFALTSSYEGYTLGLMEAQQAGLVPIAFNSTAAFSEIVQPSVSGCLIPPFDEHQYAASLLALLQGDKKRAEMSQEAVLQAHKFDLGKVGPLWLQLFQDLLSVKDN